MTAALPRRSHTETGRGAAAAGAAPHWPPRRAKDGSARQWDGGAGPGVRGGAPPLGGGNLAPPPLSRPSAAGAFPPTASSPPQARRDPPAAPPLRLSAHSAERAGAAGTAGRAGAAIEPPLLSLAIHRSPGGRHAGGGVGRGGAPA